MLKNKLYLLVIIIFSIFLFRITYLMIIKSDYYEKILYEQNNTIIYGSSAPRGRILDRNGNIIVDNVGVKTIVYNKLSGISLETELEIADTLSNIIEVSEGSKNEQKYYYYLKNKDEVNKLVSDKTYKLYNERKITSEELEDIKLNLITDTMLSKLTNNEKRASNIFNIMNKGYNYQDKIIKKDCSDEEYNNVSVLNLVGIRTELSFKRINKYGNVLENVIGDVGYIPKELEKEFLKKGYKKDDIVGVSYLEKYYEEYLKGEKAKYKINPDNTISKLSDYKRGNDLVLNIDIELQKNIENLLESEILKAKEYNSSKYYNGSYIIVSDPNDGGIVSFIGKSYSDGTFYNNEIGNINKSYTVGSVVKAASISVGYKYNVIDINHSVYDSCVKLKNKLEKCSWKKLGYINDIEALAYSSNYYQFLIAIGLTGESYKRNMEVNNLEYAFDTYRNMFASYGLGVKTGIDLENETIGIIGSTISDDLLLNLSIGQYDTYTPIELSQYINTVANGGNRIEMSLMKKIVDNDGNIILENKSNILNKVELDNVYIDRIKEGLRSVSKFGTGSYYIDSKYNASSKTGTSESILDSDLDGISDTFATTRTFISYMPSNNPIYSLVIVSPNIEYKIDENTPTYPINMYLARNISKILFDN